MNHFLWMARCSNRDVGYTELRLVCVGSLKLSPKQIFNLIVWTPERLDIQLIGGRREIR